MDPADFMMIADEAITRGRPVDMRNAIGRAYYAVFNVAADVLKGCNCAISNSPSAHGEVPRFLSSVQSNDSVMDAGVWIKDNKNLRNKADYDMQDTKVEGRKTAKFFVDEAKKHMEVIKAAFSSADRATIVADLESYNAKMKSTYKGPPT